MNQLCKRLLACHACGLFLFLTGVGITYPKQHRASSLTIAISAQATQHTQQVRLIEQVIEYARLHKLPTAELKELRKQITVNTPIDPAIISRALTEISDILPVLYPVPYRAYHKLAKASSRSYSMKESVKSAIAQAVKAVSNATVTRATCTCTPPIDWITTVRIAPEAVTTARIKSGAITTDKLAFDAVATARIKDSAVTTAKLAGSIPDSKLATITTAGKVANSATTATSENTADAIIARDDAGYFQATQIAIDVAPTADEEAATKAYVDGVVQGFQIKPAAKVLATTNVTLAGLQTIDDYTLQAGDRVLLNGQTNGIENGLWQVGASSPYTWARPSDFLDGSSAAFAYVMLTEGTVYNNTGWVETTSPATVGTTALTFTQFTGLGKDLMQNVGGGSEVYKEKVGNVCYLRTLAAGTNIALTQNTNTIDIATTDNITVPGTLDVTDLATASGGATITGTTAINTGGTASTSIGGTGAYGPITVASGSTTLSTGKTATNTLLLKARNTTLSSDTTFATLTAGTTPTMDLSSAVTQDGGYIYRAGGTTIPVADGGTGATSLTSHSLLLGGGTGAVTALGAATNGQVPIGSTGATPVLGNITSSASRLAVTNGAGTINVDTQAVLQTDTGFGEWTGSGNYFDDTTLGSFTILRGGSGYIKGVPVSWTGPQTITGLTAGNTYFIYIDSTGTIGKTTTYSSDLYTNNIVLFECLRDSTSPTNNQVTVRENHPYHHPTWVSLYEHDVIGVVIENKNSWHG